MDMMTVRDESGTLGLPGIQLGWRTASVFGGRKFSDKILGGRNTPGAVHLLTAKQSTDDVREMGIGCDEVS